MLTLVPIVQITPNNVNIIFVTHVTHQEFSDTSYSVKVDSASSECRNGPVSDIRVVLKPPYTSILLVAGLRVQAGAYLP